MNAFGGFEIAASPSPWSAVFSPNSPQERKISIGRPNQRRGRCGIPKLGAGRRHAPLRMEPRRITPELYRMATGGRDRDQRPTSLGRLSEKSSMPGRCSP